MTDKKPNNTTKTELADHTSQAQTFTASKKPQKPHGYPAHYLFWKIQSELSKTELQLAKLQEKLEHKLTQK